ncbi:MAG: iron-containing alcohol dehydrogenase [Bacteriovorax sp.]|nr:iron-containing alcohol dehydrogenase [Bacteriovorax sp.]
MNKRQKLVVGAGCIESIQSYFSENNIENEILLICAQSMSIYSKVNLLKSSLHAKYCVTEIIFSAPFLTQDDIDTQLRLLKLKMTKVPDVIVAIGGGTIIDLAKCIKATLGSSIQIFAVPSTAGTGAEATHFATVFENNKKKSIENSDLLPNLVFLDPELLLLVPLEIAKACALDTIAQATESLWSNLATVESKQYAELSLMLSLEYWKESVFTWSLFLSSKRSCHSLESYFYNCCHFYCRWSSRCRSCLEAIG